MGGAPRAALRPESLRDSAGDWSLQDASVNNGQACYTQSPALARRFVDPNALNC